MKQRYVRPFVFSFLLGECYPFAWDTRVSFVLLRVLCDDMCNQCTKSGFRVVLISGGRWEGKTLQFVSGQQSIFPAHFRKFIRGLNSSHNVSVSHRLQHDDESTAYIVIRTAYNLSSLYKTAMASHRSVFVFFDLGEIVLAIKWAYSHHNSFCFLPVEFGTTHLFVF